MVEVAEITVLRGMSVLSDCCHQVSWALCLRLAVTPHDSTTFKSLGSTCFSEVFFVLFLDFHIYAFGASWLVYHTHVHMYVCVYTPLSARTHTSL